MIRMVDRVRIQVLREAGLTLQEVAREVGVCRRSVQAVLKEPPPCSTIRNSSSTRSGSASATT